MRKVVLLLCLVVIVSFNEVAAAQKPPAPRHRRRPMGHRPFRVGRQRPHHRLPHPRPTGAAARWVPTCASR